MKHTPGPWELEYDGSLVMGHQVVAEPRWLGPDTADIDECKANAKLISAAPETLTSLVELELIVREMMTCVDDKGYLSTSVNVESINAKLERAQQAITKATS